MEKMVAITIWSDNSELEQIAWVLHDNGYHTVGIRKAELGSYENKCNWSFCKAGMEDSICVDLLNALGKIVPTTEIEEMPLFRYEALFIIGEDDTSEELVMDMEDTASEKEEEDNMEDTENITLNIGMVTRNGMPINEKVAIKVIGLTTDCTITRCTGYYKGHEEPSLKVEIYGVSCKKGVELAREFARDFNQECVACTVRFKTVFVDAMATEEERKELTEELKNQ